MVSDILNRHPRVLSLSEFISYIGIRSFSRRRPTGSWMWNLYSQQRHRTRLMLRGRYEELLYPLDDPLARFSQEDVPPILCATLPHLTERYEELFDEMAPFVRAQPRQSPADHFRHLFEWLCQRFGCTVWAERSGGSLLFASRLLHEFPEARVIHVFRDGRETAISMSRHYLFRLIAATMLALRSFGFDAMTSLARGKHWERLSFRLEPLTRVLFNPERLPWDNLELPHFGTLWSAMIERGNRMLGHFPVRAAVERQVRGRAGGSRRSNSASHPVRRPGPGRRGMAARGVCDSAPDAVEVREARSRRSGRARRSVPAGARTSRLSALKAPMHCFDAIRCALKSGPHFSPASGYGRGQRMRRCRTR